MGKSTRKYRIINILLEVLKIFAIIFIIVCFYSNLYPHDDTNTIQNKQHYFVELTGTAGNFATKAIDKDTGEELDVSYYTGAVYIENEGKIPNTRRRVIEFYERRGRKLFEITYYGSENMYNINGKIYIRAE